MSKKPDKGSGKEKGASTQTPVQRANRPGEPRDKVSELREALRQRERDLEIGAAMERVRSRSMDMQSSEELNDVLSVLYQQFDLLGIQPLTVWLTLWNPEENTFTYRSTGISGKRIQGQQVVEIEGMDIWKALYDKWKSGASEDVEVLFYSKKDLKKLFTLMAETFEGMPEEERLTVAHAPEGGYSVQGHCKFGYIGYTHTSEPTPEEKDILSRFAKEFGRVYQRFLDIRKAEAMAREAQIEAALERVRAASMAMHSSDELFNVINILSQQLVQLGIKMDAAMIMETVEDSKDWYMWLAIPSEVYTRINQVHVPYLRSAGFDRINQSRKEGKSVLSDQLTKPQKDLMFTHYFKNSNHKDVPKSRQDFILSSPGLSRTIILSQNSVIQFYRYSLQAFSEKENQVLARFGNVFEQSHTRFLDLKKAEAQAREAQVEAALERVRARSMAMHTTEEILDVVVVLFNQLRVLNIDFIQSWISIWHLDDGYMELWLSPIEGHGDLPIYHKRPSAQFEDTTVKSWLNGDRFSYLSLPGEDTVTEFLLGTDQILGGDYFKKLQKKNRYDRLEFVDANHRYGTVSMSCNTEIPEDDREILSRFAQVFEQTYTRFLDLQKAEAQAREAQIEAALERVRARSMAMNSSEELTEVLTVLFAQFDILGIHPLFAHLTMFDEVNNRFSVRITGKEGQRVLVEQFIDIDALPEWKEAYAAWKVAEPNTINCIHYPQEILPQVFGLVEELFAALPEGSEMRVEDFPGGTYTVQGHFEFGYLGYNDDKPATEEQKDIVVRFATEFGRVYRRFLDLQKAEAQARESQIEAALERVRSKTMAMHNSQDVGDTVITLFNEVVNLGLDKTIRCGIGILHGDEGMETWSANSDQRGDINLKMGMLNMTVHPMLVGLIKAWKKNKKRYSYDFIGEDVTRYYTALNNEPDYPFHADLKTLPDRQFANVFFFTDGVLFAFTHNPLQDEAKGVLERFAKVFGQTYRRYLDLQKAEAQVREAEIQLSLERIRARAMAMQESSELTEVLSVIFQQLKILGVETVWTHLTLLHQEENAFTYRMTGRNGERIMAEEKIDLDASEHWAHISDSIKSPDTDPDPITRFEVPTEGLDAIWELFDGIFSKLPKGEKVSPLDFPNGLYTTQAYCKFGFLGINQTREANPEEADILLRFTTEFSRLYQRFLDLQNAEKRAQEAQIEVALERIRARAMAMQHTEELNEVIGLLCKQYDFLGINPVCAHLSLIDVENNRFSLRLSGKKGARNIGEKIIDLDAMEEWKETVERWKKSIPQSHQCLVYPKESITQLFQVMDELIQTMPKKYRISPKDFPNGLYSCEGQNKFGYLGFNHSRPPTEEEISIVIRFAREFERIYQRFLDLEKAEAQARESEIQLALERVRARTMAMHNSEELGEVAAVLFEQICSLGATLERLNIGIIREEEGIVEWWSTEQGGQQINQLFKGSIEEPTTISKLYSGWKKGKKSIIIELTGKDLQHWIRHLKEVIGLPYREDLRKDRRIHTGAFFNHGVLVVSTPEFLPEESTALLERFSNVFEQTYTRFLDLKRAEAQARESQIEVALERVRSRAMAMHSSDELIEVLGVLFDQFDFLGIEPVLTHLTLFDEANETFTLRLTTSGDNRTIAEQEIDVNAVDAWKNSFANWKKSELHALDCIDYPPEVLPYLWEVLDEVMSALPEDQRIYPSDYPNGLYTTQGHCKYGYIGFNHSRRATEEEKEIVVRFAKEFGRLYQRFLDIKKAEAQARESQIEAALERVRARTMAMHNTDDIAVTVTTFFEELISLGLGDSTRCGIGILSPTEIMEVWTASIQNENKSTLHTGFLEMWANPMLKGLQKHWSEGKALYEYVLKGADKVRYFKTINEAPEYPVKVDLDALPPIVYHYSFLFPQGTLFVFAESPLQEEIRDIFTRFSSVFGQTYTRYLDLERAEKQARESKIEAALERVRAKAMAMHSSKDLRETITTIFEELKNLNIRTLRLGLGLLDQDKPEGEIVTARIGENDEIIEVSGTFKLTGHPVLEGVYTHFKEQRDYFPILQGDEIGSYYTALTNSVDVQGYGTDSEHYGCFLFFNEGGLYAWAAQPHSEEQVSILKKFSRVVEITYRRYKDLVESEAREKEAVKQASLDRVRAEIASMRTTKDLERITPLVWEELTTLGIPFFRCGVFIMDEARQLVHVYLTNPAGKALGAMD
ncbi:MAG: hypothetical protein WBN56_01045, partial [Robiginitalea sp.]|uniref:hypothetical protein n=1 Tax=Robiginitalea sp. TaxID=1902411 RepID=UPI003C777590